ncbi:MAG: phenylalanine--tRNA ligase subunit alpha [Chloroflexi bacterium]|nr:MAG: phenylalanine--tRNA ligase subunit alpha [Chloroflexota bacterium]RLT54786.1 MAG: phenylalanine--tRNA ligase subunit alpha [Chloroflexota bacterium]
MEQDFSIMEQAALAALRAIGDEAGLRAWQAAWLGKRSALALALAGLGQLPAAERPLAGQRANALRVQLEQAHAAHAAALRESGLAASLQAGALDVTLPGRPAARGRLHIATQTLRQICAIWAQMGFQIYRSRDVETEAYNFELLNIPPHHPARDMWDTFHTTTSGSLLRTHTSPGQIHAMREYAPEPIRVVLPGMCYRYEQITPRSEIQFNQVEGLAVGKGIRFTDLKGTLTDFARRMFGAQTRTRFRASYFPFTEPSAEMDVECFLCTGSGCVVCKQAGWLEILGCGMVHPKVLQNGGYDPAQYTGFAFGMGPERIAMLKYGIKDIRYFWGNDLRFLQQF